MSKFKFALVVLLALGMGACSSSSKVKGSTDSEAGGNRFDDGSNIPRAESGDVLKDINFAFDSSELSPNAIDALKGHANWLKSSQKKVTIEGHCDERGTTEYNLALGDRRAKAAFNYLRSLGVASGDMKTVSYGEELPLDPGHSEEAWSKNRRDHFAVE